MREMLEALTSVFNVLVSCKKIGLYVYHMRFTKQNQNTCSLKIILDLFECKHFSFDHFSKYITLKNCSSPNI